MVFLFRSNSAERSREEMVRTQIVDRGIRDSRVLHAMRMVPRDEFVPEGVRGEAYEDRPLPIGEGQTISQPLIVAAMLVNLSLQASDRVLEVGTGSGYVTALLSTLCAEVCFAGAARIACGFGREHFAAATLWQREDQSRRWPTGMAGVCAL